SGPGPQRTMARTARASAPHEVIRPSAIRATGIVRRRRRWLTHRVGERAVAVLSDGFVRGISRLGKLHPVARPLHATIEVITNVEYLASGHAEHRLDVYRPLDRAGPLPVVLYVHGGGFSTLS